MTYSNTWKLGNLSTVTVDGTTYEDAISIGLPSSVRDLIETQGLGATRKEYVASDLDDSDDVVITGAFQGTYITTGGAAVACSIYLAKLSKTVSFNAIKKAFTPAAVEIDTKMAFSLTLHPTSTPVIS